MKVTNCTSRPLTAFGWHKRAGAGEDVLIPAGASAEVNGPDHEMAVGAWLITLPGEVVCHEGPDDETGFQVSPGKLLTLGNGDLSLVIGYPGDMAEARERAARRVAEKHADDEDKDSEPGIPTLATSGEQADEQPAAAACETIQPESFKSDGGGTFGGGGASGDFGDESASVGNDAGGDSGDAGGDSSTD